MKAIGATLVAIALCVASFAADRAPDRVRDSLRGAVRSVHVDIAFGRIVDFGPFVEERRYPFEEATFDAHGDVTARRYFGDDGPAIMESWSTGSDGLRVIRSNGPADAGTGFRPTRLRPQPPLFAPLVRAANGELVFVRSYVLDAQGRVDSETLYSGEAADPKMAVATTHYAYNADGLVLEATRIMAQTDQLLDKSTYVYGRKDDVVLETVAGPGNIELRRVSYTYEYDAHGNWTKQVALMAGNDTGIAIEKIRTITYDEAK